MVYDLLMWFPEQLRGLMGFVIIFSVVPITGLLVFGGKWKYAWAYTKDWLRVIVILFAAAAVFSLLTL